MRVEGGGKGGRQPARSQRKANIKKATVGVISDEDETIVSSAPAAVSPTPVPAAPVGRKTIDYPSTPVSCLATHLDLSEKT